MASGQTGNLILTGSGGTARVGYVWLTSTNLSPSIIWATNTTGTLDVQGRVLKLHSNWRHHLGRFFLVTDVVKRFNPA